MVFLISSFLISSFIFAIYVQFSPKMGNIWLRPDHNGTLCFVPTNLFKLQIYPLKSLNIWKPTLMDINYFIYFAIVYIAISFLDNKICKQIL